MEKSTENPYASRWLLPLVHPVHPIRPWIIGFLYLVVLIPLSLRPRISGNVSSRYMTIEALVERGRLTVENSPLRAASGTPDLVRFGPHLYSDKPPVLSAMGAGIYALLYQGGIRFSGSPNEYVLANWVLVTSVVGCFSALTLVWLRQLLQAVSIAPIWADILTLAFGFGSLLLVYAVTFNNHSVAASLLTGAVALACLTRRGPQARPGAARLWWSGFLAGLAMAIDLPAGGVLVAGLGLRLLLAMRAIPWAFAAGLILPVLAHSVLQAQVTGTPLPAEMYPKAFDYPGSYWSTAGVWTEPGPRWRFGLEFLLGPQGWLTVTPVLVFATFGLYAGIRYRENSLHSIAWMLGGMTLILVIYYVWGVRRTDYSGQSFGTRHMLAASPLVYLLAVSGASVLHRRLAWVGFAVLLLVGAIYAFHGQRDPWTRIELETARRPSLRILQRGVLYPWSSYRR